MIKIKQSSNIRGLFMIFSKLNNRLIANNLKRNVFVSKDLLENPLYKKYKDQIEEIEYKFANAISVRGYLSSNINQFIYPKNDDWLLLDWNIHHLHFDESSANRNKNITRELLFLYLNKNNVYFLNILDHNFFDKTLLKIIDNNWPNVFGTNLILKWINCDNFSEKNIKSLRKNGIGYCLDINSKAFYASCSLFKANYIRYSDCLIYNINMFEKILLDLSNIAESFDLKSSLFSFEILDENFIVYEKKTRTKLMVNDKIAINCLDEIFNILKNYEII